MITGFNTDVQFEGVTYHVQTEDKGAKTPLILSLVYVGGTVIASKRTPYQDLIEKGLDERSLSERLQRQHKLICAAIRAGRVADLKKMGGGVVGRAEAEPKDRPGEEASVPPPPEESVPPPSKTAAPEPSPPPAARAPKADKARRSARKPEERRAAAPPPAGDRAANRGAAARPAAGGGAEAEVYEGEVAVLEPLRLSLLDDEGDFRAGQLATIKLHVGRVGPGRHDVAGAAVTIKVLGTTFRPLMLTTQTDEAGTAVVRALLPRFTSGRAAIIIRAVAEGETAEMRRIIHHS